MSLKKGVTGGVGRFLFEDFVVVFGLWINLPLPF
jgi:hypothetical protein